jgi:hypothetical protein
MHKVDKLRKLEIMVENNFKPLWRFYHVQNFTH